MITVDNTSTGYGARFHLKKVGPTWSLSDKQLSLEAQFETWAEAVKVMRALSSFDKTWPYYPYYQPYYYGGQITCSPASTTTWTVS